jgi:enoyl-CoA hydratase/carnithine racemase
MSAEEAKAYGLIDEVFVGRESLISVNKELREREPVSVR